MQELLYNITCLQRYMIPSPSSPPPPSPNPPKKGIKSLGPFLLYTLKVISDVTRTAFPSKYAPVLKSAPGLNFPSVDARALVLKSAPGLNNNPPFGVSKILLAHLIFVVWTLADLSVTRDFRFSYVTSAIINIVRRSVT